MALLSKMKGNKNNRHPTGKKGLNPTDSHPSISLGTKERQVLRYLSGLGDSRLNVKNYSKNALIKRSTLYDILGRLQIMGLVEKPYTGGWKITEKGKVLLECQVGVSEVSRVGCRGPADSQHRTTYRISIVDRKDFKPENIPGNRCVIIPNLTTYYVDRAECTLRITKKHVAVHVQDIVNKSSDECFFISFGIVLRELQYLESFGMVAGSISMDRPHYAMIGSVLAELIKKVDNRFYVDFGDGRKIWVDDSPPNGREVETNDEELKEKLKTLIKDVGSSDAEFKDLDKIERILGLMVRIKIEEEKGPSVADLQRSLGEVIGANKETAKGLRAIMHLEELKYVGGKPSYIQ